MASLPPGVPLTEIPLAENPTGAPPNFVDPPSLLAAVQGVGLTLAFLSLGLIAARLAVSRRGKRPFGADDAFIILAWSFAAVYTGASCSLGGVTRHAWDTPLSFLDAGYLKKLFITSIVYGPMLFFAKASILIFYYRTFQPKVWLRVGVCVLLVIMVGSYWMTVPLCFYYCMPHPNSGESWDLSILANCNHLATPGLVQAGMNIAADVAIFVLPLPIVFRLQMTTAKKLSIAGVFMTALFALIASALTAYYRVRIIQGYDVSWAGAQTYICIQAEVYTSIIVACMPSLAKIWNSKFKDTIFYRSLQSLRSLVKGGSSYNSKSGYVLESESTSHLQWRGHSEFHVAPAVETPLHDGQGICKMVTVELSSVKNQFPGTLDRGDPRTHAR